MNINLKYVGIDPSSNVATVCVLENSTPRVTSRLKRYEIAHLLTDCPERIALVVIEDGTPLMRSTMIAPLRRDLDEHHIPYIVINTNAWKSALRIRLRPAAESKKEIRELVATTFPEHPDADLRSQHGADATALALYGRQLMAPRVRERVHKPSFTIRASDDLLWRFWPMFKAQGLNRLYVELVRQLNPDEPKFGKIPTCANAGIGNKTWDTVLGELSHQGLLERDGDVLTLHAPSERQRVTEPIRQAEPQPDHAEEELRWFRHEISKVYTEMHHVVVMPRFSDIEKDAAQQLLETSERLEPLTSYYRALLDFDHYIALLPEDDDELFSGRVWAQADRARERISASLEEGVPPLVILRDNLRFLSSLEHCVKFYKKNSTSLPSSSERAPPDSRRKWVRSPIIG